MEDIEILRKRLLYQSEHRGMREMDMVLGGFARYHLKTMSFHELKQFESLLAISDQTLYGWFFDELHCPENRFEILIRIIRESIDYP